jgi:hypothetical protein
MLMSPNAGIRRPQGVAKALVGARGPEPKRGDDSHELLHLCRARPTPLHGIRLTGVVVDA